ncbi:TPA: S-adenosylhomocysteine hydrolase [Vibrio parahaemolyticus]|nr:S-adenosylhomocysteine hydrolase [Vibrio parahaemolyticus]
MSTILQRVKTRITRTRSKSVFLRSDFSDLGGYDQVGRALRLLTDEGFVMKMGYCVYIKARRNRLTNELMPDIEGGTDAAFMETLTRLKVDFEMDHLTKSYLSGEMTQIPAKTELIIKKRFSRKLAVGDVTLND